MKKYPNKRKILVVVEKSKLLVISIGGEEGRRKIEWKEKDKVLEEVRKFNYPPNNSTIYLMKSGSLKGLLKERLKKAEIVMRQVWSVTDRKFKDDFKRRMMMFDSLVLGVITYGKWEKSAEIERTLPKYIK